LDEIVQDYDFLQDFFKYEFVWDADKETEDEARRVLRYFEERDFVNPDPETGGYMATATGVKPLEYFAAPLISYLESYQIVLKGLNSFLDKKTLTEKDLLKRLQSGAHKLHKRGLLDRSEAISRVTFQNALSFFYQRGVVTRRQTAEGGKVTTNYNLPEDEAPSRVFAQKIQGFLSSLKTGL
jgi:glycerol-3-phosphate O-acyltransferase